MTANLPNIPKTRQIGFETLKDVTGFLRLDDGYILHVRVHFQRVGKAIDPTAKDPEGFPIYTFLNTTSASVMTETDYEAMQTAKKGYIPK